MSWQEGRMPRTRAMLLCQMLLVHVVLFPDADVLCWLLQSFLFLTFLFSVRAGKMQRWIQVVKRAKEMRTIVKEVTGKSVTTEMIGVVVLVLRSRILAMVDWKDPLTFRTTWSNTTFEQISPPPSFSRQRDEASRIAQELSKSCQWGLKCQPIQTRKKRRSRIQDVQI